MGRQIYWVLRTYFSNKPFLAVLAYFCFMIAIIVARVTFDSIEALHIFVPFPWFSGIGAAALAAAVGGVLAKQFRCPTSHLSPGFVKAHAGVASMWLATIVAAVSYCTWMLNQPLPAAIAFGIGSTGFMYGEGVGLVKPIKRKFSVLDTLFGLGIMLVIPLLVVSFGTYMSDLLSGVQRSTPHAHPLIESLVVYGLLLVGTGFAWRACQTLRNLAGETSALGNGPCRATTTFQSSANLVEWSFECFLASWKSPAHKSTLWNRVLRWRVGNPRIRSVLLIVFGSLGMAIFLFIPRLAGSQSWLPLRLGVYPTFMLFIASFQIAANWRKRLTCLDVESLRPTRRAPLQREWAISLTWDLLPPAFATAAIATLSFQLRDEWLSAFAWQALIAGWAEVVAMLVVLTGALWLASLAFTGIIVVIERPWLGLVIAFGVFFMGGVPFGALLGSLARRWHFVSDPGAALPLLLIPATVSAVVIVCMWRLWTQIDFDRRS